jgi:uncharacterized membrane protein
VAPRSETVLVHFYRAVVAHADVWRQRMDTTTNWAVVTTAAIISFAFGAPTAPHFVLLIGLAFDAVFLIMESRRYQTYDLWRRRFRSLNRHLIAPMLAPDDAADPGEIDEQLARIAADLGRTVPHLSLADAVGYRIRRNYGYIFAVAILTWLLKLEMHPLPATSPAEFVGRAAMGFVPGPLILGVMACVVLGLGLLASRAPSEQMLNWAEIPSPWSRWFGRRWWRRTRRMLPRRARPRGSRRKREP